MDPHDENPYAAPAYDASNYPKTTGQRGSGLHREGKLLVAAKNAAFPDRCVKCNAPAEGFRLKRKLYWHHPAYYLIIVVCNILIYAVVAIIVRQSAVYQVGVCPVHRGKRRNAILIGWGGFLLSIAAFVGAIMADEPILILPSILILLVSVIYGIVGSRIIYPKRIDAAYAWIRGGGPAFLESIDFETAAVPSENAAIQWRP